MITSILILLALAVPAGILYTRKNPQFGGRPSSVDLGRYSRSPQWKDGVFLNRNLTTMDVSLWSMPGLLKEFLTGRNKRQPPEPLHIERLDTDQFQNGKDKFIWYGHSTVLFRVSGKNILVDPMFGPDASPIGPLRTPRFSKNSLDLIDDLPQLDLILLTHDHYDHLDYASIQKLKSKTSEFWVALGLKRHLVKWGVPKDQIKEFDWWEESQLGVLRIVFTPSRHFSGRGPFDRSKSLWGGWVIISENRKIFWSGDGGYDSHFSEIGAKYGPFDWGFMECGQYNEKWHQIHMYPEEAVLASQEALVKTAVPVHWGAFSLALHDWTDPIVRFSGEASEKKLKGCYPRLGQIVTVGTEPSEPWWEL
jgi:L-ascorbate metabolism protein UlaG (beta-lactamase superfamily)